MAKDDDAWKRFREREDERDGDPSSKETSLRDRRLKGGETDPTNRESPLQIQGEGSQAADSALTQIEPLIEQVNGLYRLFSSGTEKLPPREKRQLLEAMILQLQGMPITTPASRFRVQTVIQRFHTHRDRWDKLMKDIEDGRVRRG